MPDFIVYIRKNHMEVVNLKSGASAVGTDTFTSTRLLVGNFDAAEQLLCQLMREVYPIGKLTQWIVRPSRVVVQPLEMTEGGLTQVENRLFIELVYGALGKVCFVRRVKVHVGARLSSEEALSLLDESK